LLFVMTWPGLYLTDERATLMEKKMDEHLQQALGEGRFIANFSRSVIFPSVLSVPRSHTQPQMGLQEDHVTRIWSFWGSFNEEMKSTTDTNATTYGNSVSMFDLQTDEKQALNEEFQSRIQDQLLPPLVAEMKQINEFLLGLKKVKLDAKQIDRALQVFHDNDVRTSEDLKRLTEAQITVLVEGSGLPNAVRRALQDVKDQYIATLFKTQLTTKTDIKHALEIVQLEIPQDFRDSDVEALLKNLKENDIQCVGDLKTLSSKNLKRLLEDLSDRAQDFLTELHSAKLLEDVTEVTDVGRERKVSEMH